MAASKVAIVRSNPDAILPDVERVMQLAGYAETLEPSATTMVSASFWLT